MQDVKSGSDKRNLKDQYFPPSKSFDNREEMARKLNLPEVSKGKDDDDSFEY